MLLRFSAVRCDSRSYLFGGNIVLPSLLQPWLQCFVIVELPFARAAFVSSRMTAGWPQGQFLITNHQFGKDLPHASEAVNQSSALKPEPR